MANILSISGSDPSGQAGVQADLEAIRDLGHRAFSVVTAVTAQNDERVYSVNPVDTRVFNDQLRALLAQFEFDAVKVGLLATNELAYQVYRVLKEHKLQNIVVDPVICSTSGTVMLENSAIPVLTGYILPQAALVTPNLDEAESLTNTKVRNVDQMAGAAKQIFNLAKGVGAVLIKGGHLKQDKVDILYDGTTYHQYPAERLYVENFRGTGCRLASAIATYLGEGKPLQQAVENAKAYLDEFIARQSR